MSGALSTLTSDEYSYATREIYDRVARVSESIGLRCYLPHKSETGLARGMPHSKVYQIDHRRVVNSGAVVAYIGKASLGVGAEIEMAKNADVPVVLLFETESKVQESLSRLILGNPAVKHTIPFERPEDLEDPLKTALTLIFSERNLSTAASQENWSYTKYEDHHRLLTDLTVEMQKGSKFKNMPGKPISVERWKELGNAWVESSPGTMRLFDDSV